MIKHNKIIKSLKRISSTLIINGGFLDNPGLFSGEMGIVLFILRYARLTHNELFSDYGFNLIGKIQNNIHIETPIDYKQGLAGIGSAFEYLVQCKYIKADTDEVLEELDKRLFDLDSLSCLTVEEILGIGFYAIWRIAGKSKRKQTIIKTILPPFVWILERKCQNHDFTYPTVGFLKEIVENENKMTVQYFSDIPLSLQISRKEYLYGLKETTFNSFLEQFSSNKYIVKRDFDLGLQNGLAGFGMALMTQLDGDDSWISLLPNDLIQQQDEPIPL